jgi:hypothetical protein
MDPMISEKGKKQVNIFIKLVFECKIVMFEN